MIIAEKKKTNIVSTMEWITVELSYHSLHENSPTATQIAFIFKGPSTFTN